METARHAWHALSAQDTLAAVRSNDSGLTADEAAKRLSEQGPNELSRKGGDGPWKMLWRQLHNPIGWLLIVAGIVAVMLGKYTDAAVVFGAVIINALIGFIQEYRAGKAIEELAAMVPENATVVRDGRTVTVHARELVQGDIVTLQSGDKVPADLRLFRAKNLLIEEAALTGESLPVAKQIEATAADS